MSWYKKLGFIAGAAAAGYAAYLYGNKIESRRYGIEEVVLDSYGNNGKSGEDPNLVRSLKVLHLSDLHLIEPESHKIEFLQSLADIDYDLVVITGDIFEKVSGIQYASSILARKPRLGAYAVLGNHDYYDYTMFNRTVGRLITKFEHPSVKRDVIPLVNALEAAGIQVLRDRAVLLPEIQTQIIGIDFPYLEQDKLSALAAEAPADYLKIALMHMPNNMMYLSNAGIHAAFLGHTHGGQIRIPGFGPLLSNSELPRAQASGVVRIGNTISHVSRGLGAEPVTNVRIFCPPVATLVEIRHRPNQSLNQGK